MAEAVNGGQPLLPSIKTLIVSDGRIFTWGTSDLQDWFGGDRSIPITEEVAGLGSYGKTLTVLTALDLEERLEEIEEEENLIESWNTKFRL